MPTDELITEAGAPADNAPAPVQIDWSSVTIPTHVVRETPEYKELLAESIERRQTISAMKRDAEKPPDENAQPTQPEQPELDPTVAALVQQVQALTQIVQNGQQSERDRARAQLMKEHGIPEALASMITGETVEDMTTAAKTLAQFVVPRRPESDIPSGASPTGNEDIIEQAKRRVQGTETDIFNPVLQTTLGGRAF